jgi:DNA polymerase-3 subunit gamma/tau
MSYRVLARKWRPRTFQEMVGQEHVVRALVNALNSRRLHHAFLFTGTRGVGKTTIARILAKSLNCREGITATPCGVCPACLEIDEGRFVDLLEVDAASRTGVDDTRELLENVPYLPSHGRYKVYLIDEVHMFSKSSFNALLKTLEEPPDHIKFMLATTDPQRIPVTVLSRCLQFSLKRLPNSLILAHLATIAENEGIMAETAALARLARASDGSMRDALSLLDQAIVFGDGQVRLEDVGDMLGSIDQCHVIHLLEALAAKDAARLLDTVATLDQIAPDYSALLDEFMSLLHRIALQQLIPEATDDSLADPDAVAQLAIAITSEDIQLFYQIALLGRRDLPLSPDPRGGFEMVLLRMLCFRPAAAGTNIFPLPPLSNEQSAAQHRTREASESAAPKVGFSPDHHNLVQPVDVASCATDWNTTVKALNLKGMVHQLALNCLLENREGNRLHLRLEPSYAQMRTKNTEERLRASLAVYYSQPIELKISIAEPTAKTPAQQEAQRQAEHQQVAMASISQDPNVQALCETFGAQLKQNSIRPED